MDFAACGSDLRYDLEAWHYTVTRSQDKEKDKGELDQSHSTNHTNIRVAKTTPHEIPYFRSWAGLKKYAGRYLPRQQKKEITWYLLTEYISSRTK